MNSFVRRLKLPFHYGKLLLLILQCKLLKPAAFIRSGCHSKTILTLPHKPHLSPQSAFTIVGSLLLSRFAEYLDSSLIIFEVID
jgi:hypothetical protein